MSVAAGIEVGVVGRSQPTQGLFPGKLAGSTVEANGRSGARSDTATAGSSASFPPVAGSFRSNWQAQLAALASGKTSLIAEEETLDGKAEGLDYAPEPTAANQRAATPALIADRVLSPRLPGTRPGAQPGSQPGASATNIRNGASVVQGAGLLSARTAVQTTLQAPESAETGSSTKAKSKQSVGTPPAKPVAKSPSSMIPGTANPLETATAIASGPPLAMGNPIAPLAQAVDRRPSSTDSPKSSILGNASTNDERPDQARSSPANSVDRATSAGKIETAGTQAGSRNETAAVHMPEEQGSAVAGGLLQTEADSSIRVLNAQTDGSVPAIAPSQDADPTAIQTQRASQQTSLEALDPNQTAPLPITIQANEQALPLGQGEVLPPNALLSSASGKTTSELAGGSPVAAIRQTSQRSGTAGDRSIPVAGQFAALSGEAASMVRDPVGAREPANPSPGGTETVPALRETFSALDADVAPGALTWTHAGARQAEAGFEDPALGWIGVRAESNGAGVHASLVPGSAAAAQELGTHLEGLNAYLAEHHTPLESLAMAAPEGRGAGHEGEPGSNQGMNQSSNQSSNQGTGQNPQQQGNSEPESISVVLMPDRMPVMDRSVSAAVAVGPEDSEPIEISAGTHISVMA